MSYERLKANTPKRWADPRPELTYLKYFVLLWLVFFALLSAGLLIWYVVKPLEAQVFFQRITEYLR